MLSMHTVAPPSARSALQPRRDMCGLVPPGPWGQWTAHHGPHAASAAAAASATQGAIQTMCTLAKNPEKRGAAITMLGKTVELAGHLVRHHAALPCTSRSSRARL